MAELTREELPKAWGVSRMADNDRAVLVSFERPLSDDEMRYLHEALAHRAEGQEQKAAQRPTTPDDGGKSGEEMPGLLVSAKPGATPEEKRFTFDIRAAINRLNSIIEIQLTKLRAANFRAEQAESALKRAQAEYERDRISYLGALGHPIPGDHDGKLSNGLIPVNGIAQAVVRMRDAAQAEAREMREALQEAPILPGGIPYHQWIDKHKKAIDAARADHAKR